MRSTRVLTLLLVVLVLVPAGILGWLGVRGTDRFEAELRERLQQELDQHALVLEKALEEWVISAAIDTDLRVKAAAELLARRLPFVPAGQALAEAKARGRPESDFAPDGRFDTLWQPLAVELRILDASGRPVLPVPFEPDGGGRGRIDSERLFDDLAREADAAAFGRGERARALEVWRNAATRFTEPLWKARAEVEALSLWSATEPEQDAGVLVNELERRFPAEVLDRVGRPWVLFLMRGAPSSKAAAARLRALEAKGVLTEVPLTAQERERVRELLGARLPLSGIENPVQEVRRSPLPGGLVLEVTRRWPSSVAGPAGAAYDWLRLSQPEALHLEFVSGALRPGSLFGSEPSALRTPLRKAVRLPGVDGRLAWAVLGHRDEASLLAEVARSRRWTIIGVLSLVGVIGLGLALGRSALAREREARRLKDDFLANVSHELRTPLTSVCLHAHLLAEAGLTEPQRRAHAEVVRAEGARLSALVDDLLDFAALERGSRRLEPEPVDLAAAAERAIAPFRVLADREGASLALDLVPGELLAMADPHALGRILSNLVGNAWKHGRPSRDGGPGRLAVRVGAADGRPVIDVVDDGPGIPLKERGHLFERFRRGAAAGKTRGVGLGLALSRDLARALGGDLAVIEDPTRTVFRLTLPAVPPPPPESTTGIPA